MEGMEEFFTREKANEGIELPLTLPGGGETEHWLKLRGIDSDVFREAEDESRRVAMMAAKLEDESVQRAMLRKEKLGLVASLVIDWSFEQECNDENVRKFLQEAPQIADDINRVCAKRSLFFGKKFDSSESTPNRNTDFGDRSKEVEPVLEKH